MGSTLSSQESSANSTGPALIRSHKSAYLPPSVVVVKSSLESSTHWNQKWVPLDRRILAFKLVDVRCAAKETRASYKKRTGSDGEVP